MVVGRIGFIDSISKCKRIGCDCKPMSHQVRSRERNHHQNQKNKNLHPCSQSKVCNDKKRYAECNDVFVFISEFGVNKIIVALVLTLHIVAFLGLGARMKIFVLLVLMVVPFAAPYLVTHRLTAATYSLALGDTVYETDTPYHHLLVADAYDPAYQSTVRYLILDDNFHSAMDLRTPDRIVFAYTGYFELPFLVNPNITNVLFIGGGGFTGPKAFLEHYANVLVDVTEIDPEVTRVAEQYFNVDPNRSEEQTS